MQQQTASNIHMNRPPMAYPKMSTNELHYRGGYHISLEQYWLLSSFAELLLLFSFFLERRGRKIRASFYERLICIFITTKSFCHPLKHIKTGSIFNSCFTKFFSPLAVIGLTTLDLKEDRVLQQNANTHTHTQQIWLVRLLNFKLK